MDQNIERRSSRNFRNCLLVTVVIGFFVASINVGVRIMHGKPNVDRRTTFKGSRKFLGSGDYLNRGQFITSPSGNYTVGLTKKGDLVLRDKNMNINIWRANTRKGVICTMQSDGNLVVRNKSRKSLWSSQTSKHYGSKLVVDDGGRVTIIHNDVIIWMQGTPSGNYTNPPSHDLTLPARGAFYYAWYPETWRVSSGSLTRFEPDLGFYKSGDPIVVKSHIKSFEYGNIDLGIISWFGISSNLDRSRITMIMDETLGLKAKVKWTVYYEDEMKLDPSIPEIKSDLEYLKKWYAWHPAFAHIDGKPVIFLYNDGDGGCNIINRWMNATNGEWYFVPRVFSGFKDCPIQPNAWHQYGPASAFMHHEGYSVSISPGFWKADEELPRLPRLNQTAWCQNVQAMVDSKEPWQLITTFNEAGEGTLIEPSSKHWPSDSGYGYYLDCLHDITSISSKSSYDDSISITPRKSGSN